MAVYRGGISLKYTAEQTMEEILRRSSNIRKKSEKRRTGLLLLSNVLTCVLLVVAVVLFTGLNAAGGRVSSYGAFLLSPETGGYILVAVIAFLVGISLAILVLRKRRK